MISEAHSRLSESAAQMRHKTCVTGIPSDSHPRCIWTTVPWEGRVLGKVNSEYFPTGLSRSKMVESVGN